MYRKHVYERGGLSINQSIEGETIEMKIERITTNKEPITDGAPIIYTERSEGVQAGYNIKTDRFEIAVEAMDKVEKSIKAKRENKADMKIVTEESSGNPEPTQGTN